jgi:hypothetical protein
MLPVVAIELQAAEQRPAVHVEELLSACTAALRDATCSLAADSEATTRAVVTWSSGAEVTIEVGTQAQPRAQWSRRSLRFEPADEERERWRSVGLTTALMVGDQRPNPPLTALGGFQVQGGLLVGSGTSRGTRLGLGLGADLQAYETPLWFGAHVDYAVGRGTPPDLNLSWLTFGLGLKGVFDVTPALGLEVGVEGLAQNVTVSATRGKETDTDWQWAPGGRLHLGVVWPSSEPWAGVVSAEGSLFDAPTVITRQGQHIADIPRTSVALGIGVRYRPD